MTDELVIPFEVDLAGLDDPAMVPGPGEVKRLIVDRFTQAIVGHLPGGLGHVIAADWRGSSLRFEYRPGGDFGAHCESCGDDLNVDGGGYCWSCADTAEANTRGEGRDDGVEAMRNAVDLLLGRAAAAAALGDDKSDVLGWLRGRLEDLSA